MWRTVRRILLGLLLLALVALAALRLAAHLAETEPQAPTAEGRLVDTPLGRIHVEELGPSAGPPVLLIHGSVGWARMWRPVQEMLAAQGYRAIAMDLPPMGWSDRAPDADYGRAAQADRILALARALGIRPTVVAHSFGAGPGAEAAMRDPAAFAGLVVVSGAIGLGSHGGAGLPTGPQWLREVLVAATVTNPLALRPLLRLFLYRTDAATSEVTAMLRAPFRREGTTAALARWLPTLLQPPVDALSTRNEGWQGLTLPVAFIWGDRDATTPLAQGEGLARLTGGPLQVLPDVGHIPQIEDPQAFDAALLRALAAMGTAR